MRLRNIFHKWVKLSIIMFSNFSVSAVGITAKLNLDILEAFLAHIGPKKIQSINITNLNFNLLSI